MISLFPVRLGVSGGRRYCPSVYQDVLSNMLLGDIATDMRWAGASRADFQCRDSLGNVSFDIVESSFLLLVSILTRFRLEHVGKHQLVLFMEP